MYYYRAGCEYLARKYETLFGVMDFVAYNINIKVRRAEILMRYKVNLQKTEEGYAISVPGLPGCWSQGKTEEEALENIKDAIQEYLKTVDALSKNKKSSYVEVG
jgi:predicted RNase H-like HicB family nuclease